MAHTWLKDFYTEQDYHTENFSSKYVDLEYALKIVLEENVKKSKNIDVSGETFIKDRNNILIIGSTGTGKSTFCRQLTYHFYNRQPNYLAERFDTVIWIELGRLNTFPVEKFESLSEDDHRGFIKMYFGEKCQALQKTYSDENSEMDFKKSLFIFDGFDEVENLIDHSKPLKFLLANIFRTNTVILTSRPHAKLANVFDHTDQELEILGCDIENVRKIVRNNFEGNKVEEEAFLNYINSKSHICDMMKIPLLLNIFLFVWNDFPKQNSKQITMTKLYNEFVQKLLGKYVSHSPDKKDDSSCLKTIITKLALEEYKCLCNLSIKSLENGNSVFKLGDIDGKMRSKLQKTGFLKEVSSRSHQNHHLHFEFIHRTFAEYFAASWIVNQEETELKDFVVKNKYRASHKGVFSFISGLIESGLYNLSGFSTNDLTDRPTKNKKLAKFYEYLECGSVDLSRNYHDALLIDCLKECNIDRNEALMMDVNVVSRTRVIPKHFNSFSTNNYKEREEIHYSGKSGNKFNFSEILNELEEKVRRLWNKNSRAADLLGNCREFFKYWNFETFSQNCLTEFNEEHFFEILRHSYVSKSFLTESQKVTFLAKELLPSEISDEIASLIDTLVWHQPSKDPTILERMCNNLNDDILGVYYFDGLHQFCQLTHNLTFAPLLVGYLNSKNICQLLPFIFSHAGAFESAIFFEHNRLKCNGIRSHPFSKDDILFINNFTGWKDEDHHCRQIAMKALNNGRYSGQYQSFVIKHNLSSLQKFGDKEFKNRKMAKKEMPFKGNGDFHKYLSLLYSKGYLKQNDVENLHLTQLYGSYYFSPAISFSTGPFHIDLSNSSIDDGDMHYVVEFMILNRHAIHSLILSNNKIGKPGFQRLIDEIPRTQLKHLMLDGNFIQLDQCRYEMMLKSILSKSLKTLDISGNFISKDWNTKLRNKSRNPTAPDADVMYCQLNQCKIIYKRKFIAGFVSALDVIFKKSQDQLITDEMGCCGYATKKNQFDENGNQVLIVTEIMVDGQRNLQLSELYQSPDSRFCVSVKYVDPINFCNIDGILRKSLVSRLEEYNTPVYKYMPTDKILAILQKIELSRRQVDRGEYFICNKTSNSSYSNCIQWANDMMKNTTEFKIIEQKFPVFSFMKQTLTSNRDSIGVAVILAAMFLKFSDF